MGAAGGTFLYRNCGKDATAALPHSQGGMTVECTTQWNKGKFPAMHRLAGITLMLKGQDRCLTSSTLSNSQRRPCKYRKTGQVSL